RFRRADVARAAAMGTGLGRGLDDRRPEALARHLEQAERADAADLDARTIVPHRLLEAALHRDLVAVLLHVDEIDHDEPGQVAQPELAGDLVRRLPLGL